LNASLSHPIAGLDFGSNSLRLAIARLDPDAGPVTIHRDRVALRLAGDAFGPGLFTTDTIAAVEGVAVRFAYAMDNHGVVRYRAVGTEAFRRAGNAAEAAGQVQNAGGIRLETLSAGEEASLVLKAVDHWSAGTSPAALVVDLGGGSLELIAPPSGAGGMSPSLESHPLGLAARFEEFLQEHEEGEGTRRELSGRAEEVARSLYSDLLDDTPAGGTVAFVGGQAAMLDHLAVQWELWEEEQSAGEGITLDQFDLLCMRVLSQPATVLVAAGVPPDRAPMIPGTAALYRTLAVRIQAASIRLPRVGLMDGLLMSVHQEGRPWPEEEETSR